MYTSFKLNENAFKNTIIYDRISLQTYKEVKNEKEFSKIVFRSIYGFFGAISKYPFGTC